MSEVVMICLKRLPAIAFVFFFAAAGCLQLDAQTFETLVIFDGPNGATPVDTSLVQGIDGNLYGTTLGGGAYSNGTVFKMTPKGVVTILYSFCSQTNCLDGSLPYGGLVLGNDGNLYGTTSQGGSSGIYGTVFKITPSGNLTTLHSFNGSDGFGPMAPLIQASDGNFYGMTENGGEASNAGTIFKITPTGVLTSLHSFGSGEGELPIGPLVQATDGNFYGTTELGGSSLEGTVFKISPTGTFSTLYNFDSSNGSYPNCGLVQASDGNLYGTAYNGGSSSGCPSGCGTVFKLTLGGSIATIHNFGSTDGANPIAGLIQATDGSFYGTSYGGGSNGWGTVFQITSAGAVTTLHSFLGTDGAQPYGPVMQYTKGNLYGTSTNGSVTGVDGTAFTAKASLSPFVALVQTAGRIGQSIGILGQGLASTQSVSFNGVSAEFSVRSDTFVTATVPAGATIGFIRVTTTGGTFKSNVRFRVVK